MDNDRNQEIVIAENIVEDPIEVKYENKSTTYHPQVSVDLLKMTTQYVDFLGVEDFNFIINLLLIDVTNKLRIDEKKFYATLYKGFKFQNRIKLLKHSKLLGSKDLGLNIYNHILNVLANREQNISSLCVRQCLKVLVSSFKSS